MQEKSKNEDTTKPKKTVEKKLDYGEEWTITNLRLVITLNFTIAKIFWLPDVFHFVTTS